MERESSKFHTGLPGGYRSRAHVPVILSQSSRFGSRMAKKPARRRLQGEDGTPIPGNDPVNMTSAQHIVFNLEEAGAVFIFVLSGCEKD